MFTLCFPKKGKGWRKAAGLLYHKNLKIFFVRNRRRYDSVCAGTHNPNILNLPLLRIAV